MTDDQIKETYQKMLDYFGKLPNPDHEPRQFAYYVKLYRYLTGG